MLVSVGLFIWFSFSNLLCDECKPGCWPARAGWELNLSRVLGVSG